MFAASPFDFLLGKGGLALIAGLAAALLALVIAHFRSPRPLPCYAMSPRRQGPRRRSGKSLLFGSSAMNRRESLRRRGQRVKVLLAEIGSEESFGTAWVVDRSTGGLGLLSAKALPVGRIIGVRPVHATSRMPWVEVEVKCCRGEGTEWELGCRFLHRPSWNMLLLFG